MSGGATAAAAAAAAVAATPSTSGGAALVADRPEPSRISDSVVYALVWDAALVAELADASHLDDAPLAQLIERSQASIPGALALDMPPAVGASTAGSLGSARSGGSGGTPAHTASAANSVAGGPADAKLMSIASARNVKRAEATEKAFAASTAAAAAALLAMTKPAAAWVALAPAGVRDHRPSDDDTSVVARCGHCAVLLPPGKLKDHCTVSSSLALASLLVFGGAAPGGSSSAVLSRQPGAVLLQFMTPLALQVRWVAQTV